MSLRQPTIRFFGYSSCNCTTCKICIIITTVKGYYCNIMVQSITITIAIFLPPLSIGSLVMISSSPIVNKMQWFVHWWFIIVYRSSHANSISCNDHDRYHVMELRSMNIWTLFMIIWISIFIIHYWHSPHLLDIFIPFLTLWPTPLWRVIYII